MCYSSATRKQTSANPDAGFVVVNKQTVLPFQPPPSPTPTTIAYAHRCRRATTVANAHRLPQPSTTVTTPTTHTADYSSNVATPRHAKDGEDDVADVPRRPDGDDACRRHCPGCQGKYDRPLAMPASHQMQGPRHKHNDNTATRQHGHANGHNDPPPPTTNGSPPHRINDTTAHERMRPLTKAGDRPRRRTRANENERPRTKTNAREQRRSPTNDGQHP